MQLTKNTRWPWLVCLILFAGFLTNSISSYMVSRSNMRRTITESTLPLTSDNVYSEIQRDLLSPVFISSLMAHDTFLRDWALNGEVDPNLVTKFLHEIQIKHGTVTSFFISEKSRNYYHAHGLLKQINEEDPRDSWYFNVKNISEPYEINVDLDMANKDEMTIFINYRVFDYNGEFIGVAGVGLTVSNVNHLISSYEAKYDRQIYFVDPDGQIVLRPSNSPMLGYDSLQEIKGLGPYAGELLAGTRMDATYQRDGDTRMLNCRYVPELSWFLIVEQSEKAILAPIRTQLLFNILLAIVVTAVIAWICETAIKRNQARLEKRNVALTRINEENELQKKELELTAEQLTTANATLSGLNQEKDEFISIVAHDLRNPLNCILGFCELAAHDVPDPDFELKSFVSDIQNFGERMLDLTQSLLDVSRIEEFQGTIQMDEVDCNAIIHETALHFSIPAKQKKISLELDLDETIGLKVYSKPDWLSICMNNVLSNAIKYTPLYGQVAIRSRIQAGCIEVKIEDTGPGISVEDQKKMFGKFARLSAKPTGNEASTGLGLYVVKKMCDRLNIGIRVQSVLGEGTTFILALPDKP
jgi:signal transduction histidine kinase